MSNLLRLTKYGLYCPTGDFYIDASGRVERNIVTHAHSDHAKPGHHHYLAHTHTEPLIKARLGKNISVQTIGYGESITMNGVRVSLHPAGHVFGSAQIRLELDGEIWAVSGDYKIEVDNVSEPFEPIPCHTFITECTFGLPVYHWPEQQSEYDRINNWWRGNREDGVTGILFAYSLGKAQRIIQNIDSSIGTIYVHKTISQMNEAIRSCGHKFPKTITIAESTTSEEIRGNLIIAPPSFTAGNSLRDLHPFSLAAASGWVQTGRNMSDGSTDIGFVLSDHSDWNGLMETIKNTGAEHVVTMHGYTTAFTRRLNELGIRSIEIDELRHSPYQG